MNPSEIIALIVALQAERGYYTSLFRDPTTSEAIRDQLLVQIQTINQRINKKFALLP